MIVAWRGKRVGEFDSTDIEGIDFDRLVENIAEAILEADRNQAISDLIDWFEDDARWFLDRLFNEGFGNATTEDFMADAVASALGRILDDGLNITCFNLEVVE